MRKLFLIAVSCGLVLHIVASTARVNGIDIPLEPWRNLISFRPPLNLQQEIFKRGAVGATSATIGPVSAWHTHKIERAFGKVNLDFYPVLVTSFPNIEGHVVTPEQFLAYIRLKVFTDFLDDTLVTFGPLTDGDKTKWESLNPVGSVLRFRIKFPLAPPLLPSIDDGDVVLSDFSLDHWTFSTLFTNPDLAHPVSGNRMWGFERLPGGSCIFFTRGADRISQKAFSDESVLGGSAAQDFIFESGDRLWIEFQKRLKDFVNNHQGTAEIPVGLTVTGNRLDWNSTKTTIFKPKMPWLDDTFMVTDLGVVSGSESRALALNDSNVIVGDCTDVNGKKHAFVWVDANRNGVTDASEMRLLMVPANVESSAASINNSGVAVGFTSGTVPVPGGGSDSFVNAILWGSANFLMLGSFTGPNVNPGVNSKALAISNMGQVIGVADRAPTDQNILFSWQDQNGNGIADLGEMKSLPTLSGSNLGFDEVTAINNSGAVVGNSELTGTPLRVHAFSLLNGTIRDLGTIAGPFSHATAVNNRGEIAGFSNFLPTQTSLLSAHAVLWKNNTPIDLGTLGGARSIAFGINDSGTVVGMSTVGGGVLHAFIWTDSNNNGLADPGEMRDLNSLINTIIPGSEGWVINQANAINKRGFIVGSGEHNHQRRAFLLIPMSENIIIGALVS